MCIYMYLYLYLNRYRYLDIDTCIYMYLYLNIYLLLVLSFWRILTNRAGKGKTHDYNENVLLLQILQKLMSM